MDILTNISNYYDTPAISQSMLKALMTGIGTYQKEKEDKFKEEAEHFILGNAVDTKLLLPMFFEDQFYVTKDLEKKPSDTVMAIVREVFSKRSGGHLSYEVNAIYDALNSRNFAMNRKKDDPKEDTRVLGIINDGQEYWNELLSSDSRTILSVKELETIETIVNSFKNHKHTKDYFSDNLSIYPQVAIYFKYPGYDYDCKALLDMIIVDNVNKTIQPIDIKTIGKSTKAFPSNAKKLRYDLQGAWYTIALKSVDEIPTSYLNIDKSEYKILPFKFIVESTDSPGICPLVYTMTDVDYEIANYGSKIITPHSNYIHSEYSIYGLTQAMERYDWHYKNDIWDMDMNIYLSNGDIDLQLFGNDIKATAVF